MKVALKFAFAFVACALLSVVVYSAVAANREVERLETTVAEDLASLGRVLGLSVRDTWEREGDRRAMDLVGIHDRAEAIDARWIWLDVDGSNSFYPRGGLAVVPSLLRNEQLTWVGVTPQGARLVYAYVPIIIEGRRPAALELSRPLPREADLFRNVLRDQLLTSTVFAGFATALAVFLTSWIVSGPLARVAAQARRIGAGDLSQRLEVRGRDEVAELVRELNAMADRLDASRKRADDEADKRIQAVEQLRHADRLRTVGTLASGIAHELGTPLNVIAMRAKMIATGEVKDEAPDNAKVIVAQTDRVTKIVRQLLDFARRRTPQRARTDLRELAERTSNLLLPLAKKTNVSIEVERGSAVVADVDGQQIEQALTNLVMNGIHAMPDGGVLTVFVRETEATPPEAPDTKKTCALIEVKDTGVGISEENLARISEPFFTTKGVGVGTGLGLSVTHGFIQDHGGWMTAESTVGRGSVFKVYLPV